MSNSFFVSRVICATSTFSTNVNFFPSDSKISVEMRRSLSLTTSMKVTKYPLSCSSMENSSSLLKDLSKVKLSTAALMKSLIYSSLLMV